MKKKILIWSLVIIIALLIIYFVLIPLLFCTRTESIINNPKYSSCSQDSDCAASECGCLNENWLVKIITSLCGPYMGCKVPSSCTCENNQCQAHYNYGSEGEGVILITDKTEYYKGEEVKVTIKNNLDGEIEFWIIGIGLEEIKEDSNIWKDVRRDIDCPCMALCEKMAIILSPGEERSFIWNQIGDDCQQVESGTYRARTDWSDPRKAYLEVPTVVSNEFIIK